MPEETSIAAVKARAAVGGLLADVWRFRWLTAGVVLLATLAGYASSTLEEPYYQAEARLLLADPRSAGLFGQLTPAAADAARHVRNRAARVTSRAVLEAAASRLDGLDAEGVRRRVWTEPSADVDVIGVHAVAGSATEAAEIVNAVARAYQQLEADDARARAEAAVAEFEQVRGELQARIDAAERRIDPGSAVDQAVARSRAAFPDQSAEHAIIVRADDDADALAGAGLGFQSGPLLFTARTAPLLEPTRAELQRVLPPGSTVYLLGGSQALSPEVEGELTALGYVPERLAGLTRVQTADEIRAKLVELRPELADREPRIVPEAVSGGHGPAAVAAERDATARQLEELQGRAQQIAVDAALYAAGLQLVDLAEPPEHPAGPRPFANATAGLVVGLLAGPALARWRAEANRCVLERDDGAALLDEPMLAEVPRYRAVGVAGKLPVTSAPRSDAAEAYHFAAASLELALQQLDGAVVLVTSPTAGDGKTTTAVNLALAAHRRGHEVLLVDADLRVGGLTGLAGLGRTRGLRNLGAEGAPLRTCLQRWDAARDLSLPVVPHGVGVGEPAAFFRGAGFRDALATLRGQARVVLVDAPPLLEISDTSMIAGRVDAVVLVIPRGLPLAKVQAARERLAFIGVPMLGWVYNRSERQGSRLPGRHGRRTWPVGDRPPAHAAR